MKDMGLQVHQRRRKIRITVNIGSTPYPNLLKNLDILGGIILGSLFPGQLLLFLLGQLVHLSF
jgi:hypothetical protein